MICRVSCLACLLVLIPVLRVPAQMTVAVRAAVLSPAVVAAVAVGGEERPVPSLEYFLAFGPYYEGDYGTALRAFQGASRGAIRSGAGPWVDSVCYFTMTGECLLQMGELAKALDQYTAAVKLAVAHDNWLMSVQFQNVPIRPVMGRRPVPWGVSTRNMALVSLPDRIAAFFGRLDNENVIKYGGVVAQPELHPVNVKEIVRCTALAIRRRYELMGPLCPHDPLTTTLLGSLSRRPAPPNHWSQSWISCELGLALASSGKPDQAAPELMKALVLNGQYDYELTSMALLELGKLAFAQRQYKDAAKSFFEATIAAAAFEQHDVIEEAFRWGLTTHLVSGEAGPYAPVLLAAPWALRKSRALHASLLLMAAESAAARGSTGEAVKLLGQTRQAVHTREMGAGTLGARFNYQSALVKFQGGQPVPALADFAKAMSFQRATSRWLFQIGLVDTAFTTGAMNVTPRVADTLYTEVLREPTGHDWTRDPMDTLAVVSTPHAAALEHWLEAAVTRKEEDKAIEIAERLRRHRFHSTLAMGGRLLALRWLLEAPQTALSATAKLQRQDLLNRYPGYADLSAKAADLRKQLEALPLGGAAEQAQQYIKLFDQLAQVGGAQEIVLSEIALRREASEYVFPPLLTVKEIQQQMPDGQLILAYIVTDRGTVVFAISREKRTFWTIESPKQVTEEFADLLKQWGLEKRGTVAPDLLATEKWKETAALLLQDLTNRNKPEMWDAYREVVIVPDGILWYVPFEALPLAGTSDGKLLMSKVRVRYVPTVALANLTALQRKPRARTAVIAGKLYVGQDEKLGAEAAAAIEKALPESRRFGDRLPVPSSLLGATLDRAVVLSDLEMKGGPYDWCPLHLDRGKAGASLDSWLGLPWPGPAELVLPGFHTAVETGLKRTTTGSEVFLASCGLMAAGSRTILLSRWPVLGQSTYDLTREFVQELPFSPAAEAWQRSVELLRNATLDLEREPRVTRGGPATELTGRHPLFWAGHLLIDTGSQPITDEPKKVEPPKKSDDAKKVEELKKADEPKKAPDAKKAEAEKKPDDPPKAPPS